MRPVIETTKGLPRAIVCGILRENYRDYPPTQEKVKDKKFESIIEFHKERQKSCWEARYKKYQELWDYYFKRELNISPQNLQDYLVSALNSKKYPKHLEKNLNEAINKWK